MVPTAGVGEVVGRGEAEVETGRSLVRNLFVAVDPVRVVLAQVRARLTCDEKFRKVNKLCPKIQYLGRGKSYSDILLFFQYLRALYIGQYSIPKNIFNGPHAYLLFPCLPKILQNTRMPSC